MLGFFHKYRDTLPDILLVIVGLYFVSVYFTRPELPQVEQVQPSVVVEEEAGFDK